MIAVITQLLIIAAALLGVLVQWHGKPFIYPCCISCMIYRSCCQEFGSPLMCLNNLLDVLPAEPSQYTHNLTPVPQNMYMERINMFCGKGVVCVVLTQFCRENIQTVVQTHWWDS